MWVIEMAFYSPEKCVNEIDKDGQPIFWFTEFPIRAALLQGEPLTVQLIGPENYHRGMHIDGHLNGTGKESESVLNSWQERLMATIGLRKLSAVFLARWDEELVTGEHNGEVLVVC